MKGYFHKRGNTWTYKVDIGVDPVSGKRKQKSKGGFKTKKEAQAACAELLSQFNKGIYVEEKDIELGPFMENWLNKMKHEIKESTFKNYKRAVSKRIIPQVGKLKLTDLKTFHGQEMVDAMVKEELSPRYIEYVMTVFKSSIEYAVKTEYLVKNPLKFVSLPRPRRIIHNTWSFEEVNRFLTYAKMDNPVYYIVYNIALKTGLRRGEVLGLPWKNVDLDNKMIRVTQTLQYDGDFSITDPKTSGSVRSVTIDDDLIQELKRHKRTQSEFKLAIGQDYNSDMDLVCCREDGNPIYPRTLAHNFDQVIKKSSVPKIRIHDMRHTHLTLLLELGVHPKVVSERAGHSSVKITLDTYSHVSMNMQQETAQKFSEAMKNKKMV